MKKTIFLAIITLASISFAAYSFCEMVLKNKSPFTIECIGVRVDPNIGFTISNSKKKEANSLMLEYPQAKGLLPDSLGYIANKGGKVTMQLPDEIVDIKSTIVENPFWAIVKNQTKGYFSKNKYFNPNTAIEESDLSEGVKFNSAFGNRFTRVSLKLIFFNNEKFVRLNSEGVGTKYIIKADTANIFGLCLNIIAPYEVERVFSFSKSTNQTAFYTIEVTANSFRNVSYTIRENGTIVKTASGNNLQFEASGYLFSVNPKYPLPALALYIFTFIFTVLFQFYLLKGLSQISSPLILSAESIRLHLNNLFFVATPIFLTSLTVTENRGLYLLSVIAIDLSFFLPKSILHKFNYQARKFGTLIFISLLLGLPILMFLKHSQEALFGIPILHFQKLLTLILIYFSQTKVFKSISINYWFKVAIFIVYSLLLSFITKDIGSFIYTASALFFIEMVKAKIAKAQAVLFVAAVVIGISLIYKWIPNSFSDDKLYRIVSPYTSPASSNLTQAPEADKQTYSYLHLIQKALLSNHVGDINSTVIPVNMRSTSFSDFAFYWSVVYGKVVFLVLFFFIYFLLISDLLLLLYASLRSMRINKEYSFVLPHNKESAFISFLIAFAIISFSYPVFSNLLLLPLTGQSLPFISISNFEGFYYLLFLIPLSSFFTNPRYLYKTSNVGYTYGKAKLSRQFNLKLLGLFIFCALILKAMFIFRMPPSFIWDKQFDSSIPRFDSIEIHGKSKEEIVSKVNSELKEDKILNIPNDKKAFLRNFATYYYSSKSYFVLRPESPRFENTLAKVTQRINFDSLFTIPKVLISGENGPFGRVYAFNQQINNESLLKYSNSYYSSITKEDKTVNADLTALLSYSIEKHLQRIGIRSNTGSILIVDNNSGAIISNACFPHFGEKNEMEIPYFVGSVKKIILAYSALAIDPAYFDRKFNGKSFSYFLEWSDDNYAAALLKHLMLNHENEFKEILFQDFSMPFTSNVVDAYFQELPDATCYLHPLDYKNYLYRIAIGQEKPYTLADVVKWYARIANGKKLLLNSGGDKFEFDDMSINKESLNLLRQNLGLVIKSGTAAIVGNELKNNNVPLVDMFGKTGTAQYENEKINRSSSLILCTEKYTIGIAIKGRIPTNNDNLAAKNLMANLIPTLKKYKIL